MNDADRKTARAFRQIEQGCSGIQLESSQRRELIYGEWNEDAQEFEHGCSTASHVSDAREMIERLHRLADRAEAMLPKA